MTKEQIYNNGGGTLLRKYYSDSMFVAIPAIYPEHKWIPWKFERVPRGFWANQENQREFFDWLSKELGFKTLEEWYKLKKDVVRSHGGSGLVNRFDSLATAIQVAFQNKPWKYEGK